MSANNPEYDFKWCPGCGDFGVRRALESAIQQRHAATGIAIENIIHLSNFFTPSPFAISF